MATRLPAKTQAGPSEDRPYLGSCATDWARFVYANKEIEHDWRICTFVVVAATLIPISAFAQGGVANQSAIAGQRIGGLSPQRVFSESAEGKAGIARLRALQEEKARAIDEKNQALQSQEQALQQNAPVLNEEARTQRSNAVEKFRIDVQRFIQDAQAEVLGVQREVEGAFVFKLKPAVEKVAKDKGLQIVFNLDEGLITWADPSLDITADVVKQLALAVSPSKP